MLPRSDFSPWLRVLHHYDTFPLGPGRTDSRGFMETLPSPASLSRKGT